MEDKAVSTEDLCRANHKRNVALSLARLEAILQTLVESKVESLKNDNRNQNGIFRNQKSILKRLRLTSTASSHSTTKNEEDHKQQLEGIVKIGIMNEKKKEVENFKIKSALKKESSISSAFSQLNQSQLPSFEASSASDEDRIISVQYDDLERPPSCCCNKDVDGELINFDHVETDTIMSEDAIRRAKRKRRKRRKRRMKKRMALAQHEYLVEAGVIDENFKRLTVEDSTKKAKWTIVATAFLLLFMCLLLVGITLRMAPIIDEMVRKENEEFVNSLNRHKNMSSRSSVQNNT